MNNKKKLTTQACGSAILFCNTVLHCQTVPRIHSTQHVLASAVVMG